MELNPGSRWKSAVCTAEFVVVRPAAGGGDLICGGHPLLPYDAQASEGLEIDSAQCGMVLVGKRYHDLDSGLEMLATKAGRGLLVINGRVLALKEAKPLPASD